MPMSFLTSTAAGFFYPGPTTHVPVQPLKEYVEHAQHRSPTTAARHPATNRDYSSDIELEIRQQPKEALLTIEGKEKVRKPVDPPPIVQLKVKQTADPSQHFLQSPYLFMACSLMKADKDEPLDRQPEKTLVGSLVSSLHRLKDVTNHDGAFFVFGDISVKVAGEHRLMFSLFEYRKDAALDGHGPPSPGTVVFLKSVISDPFKVVLARDFKGLDESTYLSRAFSDQGVRLRLRKEPRTMLGRRNTWMPPPQSQDSATTGPPTAGLTEAYSDEPPAKRARTTDVTESTPGGSPSQYPAAAQSTLPSVQRQMAGQYHPSYHATMGMSHSYPDVRTDYSNNLPSSALGLMQGDSFLQSPRGTLSLSASQSMAAAAHRIAPYATNHQLSYSGLDSGSDTMRYPPLPQTAVHRPRDSLTGSSTFSYSSAIPQSPMGSSASARGGPVGYMGSPMGRHGEAVQEHNTDPSLLGTLEARTHHQGIGGVSTNGREHGHV